MELKGEYVFDGPRDKVWKLVRDPEVLATALPGTQSMNQVSESEYEGKMNIRVGPIAGVFDGQVVVSDEVPPESYTLSVEGRGAPGFGRGTGHIQLIDQGDATTLMKYEGELHVGGKLAGVGQRMIETVSKSMTRQGLESLNKALQARMTAEGEGAEIEYTAPSELEYATAVVKDLAAEIFSPAYRTAWGTVAVAALSMAVGFWFGRRYAGRG